MSKTLGIVPIGLLVLAALVYALVFPLNRLASEAGAPHFGHAFWQTLIGGLALYLLTLVKGERLSLRWPYLRAYLVVGAFGFSLPMALVTLVSPNLPGAIVPLAFALSPTCTYLLSVLMRLDRLSTFGLVGIALGFAGVAIVLAPEEALPHADALGWFLLTLAIPVLLAIANVGAAVLRPPATSSTVMGAGFLLGAAAVILSLMLATDGLYVPSDMALLLPTLGAAAVNAVFIILFAEIVGRYGPTFFAQFNYLTVVAAIGWAALFFGEQASVYVWAALALMASGVLISELRHRGAAKQT
ncbi:MAG: DMT family transporter [Rhodospirillales bacterium]